MECLSCSRCCAGLFRNYNGGCGYVLHLGHVAACCSWRGLKQCSILWRVCHPCLASLLQSLHSAMVNPTEVVFQGSFCFSKILSGLCPHTKNELRKPPLPADSVKPTSRRCLMLGARRSGGKLHSISQSPGAGMKAQAASLHLLWASSATARPSGCSL